MTSGTTEQRRQADDHPPDSSRRKARRKAFELLFELEQHPGLTAQAALERSFGDPDALSTYWEDEDQEGYCIVPATESGEGRWKLDKKALPYRRFVTELVEAVDAHIREIDAELALHPHDWTFERIGAAERSLLRLAVAEMSYIGTAYRVVINEILELSKDYCADDAVPFVNGILGGVVRNLEKSQESKQDSLKIDVHPAEGRQDGK